VAQGLNDGDLKQIRKQFILTSKLEYLFWDMGFHKQTWRI
jgi:thiaminase